MLRLHFHPLSSYCQKALIGLYELGLAFDTTLVDLGDERSREAFLAIAPLGKFPVLEVEGRAIAESSILLERVDAESKLFSSLEARALDRFWDLHVHEHMQQLVANKLRPEAHRDAYGAAQRRAAIERSYAIADRALEGRTWSAGESFSIADCAAAPALFFAQRIVPFAGNTRVEAYFARLSERPSVARAFAGAAPYLAMFPGA